MDKFIRYLKQRVPNSQIEIPDEISKLENQDFLLSEIASDIASNPAYFKPIFKQLLFKQEVENFEINENFYSIYIERLMPALELSPLDHDYLTYEVSKGKTVTIKETPRLISGLNTTGLRTWELSIYLSYFLINEYLPQHPEYSRILELGTGTGLIGLSLNKYTNVETFMTDGDSQLIENLSSNFQRNQIPIRNCFQYIWGDDLRGEFDLCVGADITYDVSILEPLVITFDHLFQRCKTKTVLIACTVRNELTVVEFERLLGNRFVYKCLDVIAIETMFISPTSQLKIFEISPMR